MTVPGDTLTVHVPFTLRKRGGRKMMIVPEGRPVERARVDNSIVKALARAFRWKRLIDSGAFATIGDLAAREKLAPSYLSRVLRLTQLAPEIVEQIIEGRQGPELTLAALLEPFPTEWHKQKWGQAKDM